MINLRIQPYCEECGDFEAEVEKCEIENFFGDIICDTEITCKNKDRCEKMIKHLKERYHDGE